MIAIYARQSVDKKDSISIDTQIEFCKHEAKGEPYKVYSDKGYSGKNTNRPAFERMMRDVEDGKIEKVIVYRLDRVSRSIVDFADFISTLEQFHASFISATEKFDTSAPMGRAMLYIVVVFAQLERETIAERIKDNYYERLKRGGIGGGPAPYGFDIERKKMGGITMSAYKENENIENVISIFDEYAKPNTSLADVQRLLKKKGILTSSGKPWDNVKLASLLKSPVYVKADLAVYNYYRSKNAIIASPVEEFDGIHGCLLAGKRESNTRKYNDVTNHVLVVSSHNGVIDSDTFLYCQEKLSNNRQIKNLHKGKHSWLTGFVKCGHCGYAFSVRISKTTEGPTPYFYCSGKYLHKVCDVKQVHRVKDVEEMVEHALIDAVKNNTYRKAEQPKDNTAYQKKLSEIDAKIENLILSLEDSSTVSASYINKRIEALDQEKQNIIQAHAKQFSESKIVLPSIKDYDNMSFDEKKLLAQALIEKVYLSNKGLEITWK